MLTTVMYHYVGWPSRPFPNRKQLLLSSFLRQLDYLTDRYTLCSLEQVVSAVRGHIALPPDACLLTFDDGLLDHYTNVFPILRDHGLPGVFYVPAGSLTGGVLDVHKVQSILATSSEHAELVEYAEEIIATPSRVGGRAAIAQLRERFGAPSRFDRGDTVFLKSFLQRGPEPIRHQVLTALFDRFVPLSEDELAGQLYLTSAQIRAMREAGMSFGGHTIRHPWLSDLDEAAQKREIRASRQFVETLDPSADAWTFAYPYGDYDTTTLHWLRAEHCALAFTTEPRVTTDLRCVLELSRLDCVDLPVR